MFLSDPFRQQHNLLAANAMICSAPAWLRGLLDQIAGPNRWTCFPMMPPRYKLPLLSISKPCTQANVPGRACSSPTHDPSGNCHQERMRPLVSQRKTDSRIFDARRTFLGLRRYALGQDNQPLCPQNDSQSPAGSLPGTSCDHRCYSPKRTEVGANSRLHGIISAVVSKRTWIRIRTRRSTT